MPIVVGRIPAVVRRRPGSLSHIARHFALVDPDAPKRKQQKAKKREGSKRDAADTGPNRDLQVLLDAYNAPGSKPPPADEEEMKRRETVLKNYTIGCFKRHNEENHDIAAKLRLKDHAMKMLPRGSKLKEAAFEIDDEGPPRWRNIPAWTAPIPGFDPNEFIDTEE